MNNIFQGCMPALMTPCNEDLTPNFDLLVIKGKELIAAIEEERISRIKNDGAIYSKCRISNFRKWL